MRKLLAGLLLVSALAGTVWAFQRGVRSIFRDDDYDPAPPPGHAEHTEFYFARLRYQMVGFGGGSVWRMRGGWTTDYPKADRTLLKGIRRLTRIQANPMERVVDLISDDIYNYPFVYVVEAGHWELPDAQAKKLREFTDRGGFLMTDDFHGTFEWEVFTTSLNKGFGDRTINDIDDADPIFHVLYDLTSRFQVPGLVNFPFDKTYEYDGFEPKWRAVRDDRGRIVVGICHNMDLGDAYEWADHPRYPEKYASQAYRTAINYIIYAMTH
ncbi:MAG: DUF4159 domain-containing protein [Acidobacteria bacterium]|nr:DUF4159 domain-containing protein [Acidobacteriota bacterium]